MAARSPYLQEGILWVLQVADLLNSGASSISLVESDLVVALNPGCMLISPGKLENFLMPESDHLWEGDPDFDKYL